MHVIHFSFGLCLLSYIKMKVLAASYWLYGCDLIDFGEIMDY
jgi:hypothetical protein